MNVTVDYPSEKLKPLLTNAIANLQTYIDNLERDERFGRQKQKEIYNSASFFTKFWNDFNSDRVDVGIDFWNNSFSKSRKEIFLKDMNQLLDLCDLTEVVRLDGDSLKSIDSWVKHEL